VITTLKPNQIFVFGSNTGGIHGRGAALQARKYFGALQRVGEGLMGSSYALPTLDYNPAATYGRYLTQRSEEDLDVSISTFLAFAEAHPELEFLLTKVGCGLAGYNEEFIKPKFASAPKNVVRPEGW
jgi:hypothetical protein